jgi:hypothetical protein
VERGRAQPRGLDDTGVPRRSSFLGQRSLSRRLRQFATGKLSDAAGLIVVTLIALPWFPRRTGRVLGAIAAAFVAWKSPASQPRSTSPRAGAWQIGRVVDYTDRSHCWSYQ